MEILELLGLFVDGAQGCGCFLEILTGGVDLWAGNYTAKHWRRGKDRETKQVVTMICLIAGAMALTALVAFKWLGPKR
jgi:uncharacterized membrane protein YeaQ/YmgE (transglycosylase-associated protein family)